MEDNKKEVNINNDANDNTEPAIMEVEYSGLTKRMMDRDAARSARKAAKAASTEANDPEKKPTPKWRKAIGWVAAGAAAAGAVTWAVLKSIAGRADDNEASQIETDPETEESVASQDEMTDVADS